MLFRGSNSITALALPSCSEESGGMSKLLLTKGVNTLRDGQKKLCLKEGSRQECASFFAKPREPGKNIQL